MRKVAFIFLWLLVFGIPIESLIVIEGTGTLTRVVGLFALVVGLVAVAQSGQLRNPNGVFILGMLFLGWMIVGSVWSVDQIGAVSTIRSYVQLMGLMWLIWEFNRSVQSQRKLMTAFVMGSLVTAAQTVLSYAEGAGRYAGAQGRYVAEGFDPNTTALLLGISIPMAFYLMGIQKKPVLAWLFRLHCAVAALSILLTASRGALLATMVGVALLPWSTWATTSRRRISLVAGGLLTVGLIVFYVPPTTWLRLGTVGEQISSGELGGRGRIWLAALQVVGDHPLLGVGTGGFWLAIGPVLGQNKVAHNVFLSVLVDHGVIGLSLYLAMFAGMLLIVLRLQMAERRIFLAILAVWFVGAMSLDLQGLKSSWFLIGLVASLIVPTERSWSLRTRAVPYKIPMQPQGPPLEARWQAYGVQRSMGTRGQSSD